MDNYVAAWRICWVTSVAPFSEQKAKGGETGLPNVGEDVLLLAASWVRMREFQVSRNVRNSLHAG